VTDKSIYKKTLLINMHIMEKQKIYWLNADSRKFLSRGYVLEEAGETAESRMRDIAVAAETRLGIAGFADKFESYLHKGFYSLSSPIWSNSGRVRGLPISCFGTYIDDTLEEIAGYKIAEISMMTKNGGGTSAYFGALRGRGTPISTGGTSTGAVHFMELYDKLMSVVSQGNVRRGSFAAYLPIDHPDIEEFLKIKGEGHTIQDMSIGVTVSDAWMKRMIDGDKDARKTWGLVIKKRFESGYPYLFFTDTANNAAPQVYKDKGKRIHASNLCLTGDTLIDVSINSDGSDHKSITLEEFCFLFKLNIWDKIFVKSVKDDQSIWAQVTVAEKTGKTNELIEILSDCGKTIRCTPDHKILTKNRDWVCAKDLVESDELILE
jgi:ribonucleoside-diphosphate reductase alpha chain